MFCKTKIATQIFPVFLLMCFYSVNASNITNLDGLLLSKIIKNQNEIGQNKQLMSESNVQDNTEVSDFELVTILHSQISGNFKLWHLILIVLFSWICFCKYLQLFMNIDKRRIYQKICFLQSNHHLPIH